MLLTANTSVAMLSRSAKKSAIMPPDCLLLRS
jgi:hypothetical protein